MMKEMPVPIPSSSQVEEAINSHDAVATKLGAASLLDNHHQPATSSSSFSSSNSSLHSASAKASNGDLSTQANAIGPGCKFRRRSSSLTKLGTFYANGDGYSTPKSPRDRSQGRNNSHEDVSSRSCGEAPMTYDEDDLEIGPLIGKGFFGEAYLVTNKADGRHMVMKRLFRIDQKAKNRFLKEVSVMRQLSHRNVLRFLGILYMDRRLHLVTEHITGGSLKQWIEDLTREFSWTQRVQVARDVAAGMAYLHSMKIIHRDLNSGNILIRAEDESAVVADFGLARLMSASKGRDAPRRYTVVGSCYWMAPEMLRELEYNHLVDVFSFGITLCEIIGRISAENPDGFRTSEFGVDRGKFLSSYCTDCPPPLSQVAFRCTEVSPDRRPEFDEVLFWFDKLLEEVKKGSGSSRFAKLMGLIGL